MGGGFYNWFHLVPNRNEWRNTVNSAMNNKDPIHGREFLDHPSDISFSEGTPLHKICDSGHSKFFRLFNDCVNHMRSNNE